MVSRWIKKNEYNSTVLYKIGEVWANSSIMLKMEVNHEIGRPVELLGWLLVKIGQSRNYCRVSKETFTESEKLAFQRFRSKSRVWSRLANRYQGSGRSDNESKWLRRQQELFLDKDSVSGAKNRCLTLSIRPLLKPLKKNQGQIMSLDMFLLCLFVLQIWGAFHFKPAHP